VIRKNESVKTGNMKLISWLPDLESQSSKAQRGTDPNELMRPLFLQIPITTKEDKTDNDYVDFLKGIMGMSAE